MAAITQGEVHHSDTAVSMQCEGFISTVRVHVTTILFDHYFAIQFFNKTLPKNLI